MSVCLAAVFRDSVDFDQFGTTAARLAIAALLGAIIGFERQWERKSAGLRTHMLVALGAAVFMLVPDLEGTTADAMSRVIQGIATGVGFLGAGAILKANDEQQVRGLTTAASIWVTAGAGMAVGAGYLWPAFLAIALGWFILGPMQLLEDVLLTWLGRKKGTNKPDSA